MTVLEARLRHHPGTGSIRLFGIRYVNNDGGDFPWKKPIKEKLPDYVVLMLGLVWDEHKYPLALTDLQNPKEVYGIFRRTDVIISPEGIYIKLRSNDERTLSFLQKSRTPLPEDRSHPTDSRKLTQVPLPGLSPQQPEPQSHHATT
jgi:hypothetical protein